MEDGESRKKGTYMFGSRLIWQDLFFLDTLGLPCRLSKVSKPEERRLAGDKVGGE